MILSFDTYLTERSHHSSNGIQNRRLRGALNGVERDEMKRRLRHNIITFRFQKRDGTIRKAKGTLHKDYLPPLRGGSQIKPEHQLVYYDLDKHGWRSFRSFKFIKILNMRPISDDDEETRTRHDETRHNNHDEERHNHHRDEETRDNRSHNDEHDGHERHSSSHEHQQSHENSNSHSHENSESQHSQHSSRRSEHENEHEQHSSHEHTSHDEQNRERRNRERHDSHESDNEEEREED